MCGLRCLVIFFFVYLKSRSHIFSSYYFLTLYFDIPCLPYSMDSIIKSTFPIFTSNPFFLSTKRLRPFKVSIKPPPPDFDYRLEISEESRAAIAESHPELLDLAENGSLVLVQKKRFGPVPSWRTEFVEPEEIWLVGTTHVSKESAMEVERVVRALRPDNVVVELCRSRQALQS